MTCILRMGKRKTDLESKQICVIILVTVSCREGDGMKKENWIQRFLLIFLCLFVIFSYQIPTLGNTTAGSHSIFDHDSTMEPMDFSGNHHPKAMIRKSMLPLKLTAVNPLQYLFTILSILMIFRVPMIEPPFKVFYDNIKRRLYLKPVKFTSTFVSA